MTNELPKELITSALELCGKSMEEMYVGVRGEYEVEWVFSHPSFFYYLCSIPFIQKYLEQGGNSYTKESVQLYAGMIVSAIGLYQLGDETLLIQLLSKICPTDQNEAH